MANVHIPKPEDKKEMEEFVMKINGFDTVIEEAPKPLQDNK